MKHIAITPPQSIDKELTDKILQDTFNRIPEGFEAVQARISTLNIRFSTVNTPKGMLRVASGKATVKMTLNSYIDSNSLNPQI
jgi:hypothetical protein